MLSPLFLPNNVDLLDLGFPVVCAFSDPSPDNLVLGEESSSPLSCLSGSDVCRAEGFLWALGRGRETDIECPRLLGEEADRLEGAVIGGAKTGWVLGTWIARPGFRWGERVSS
jgi:hypothetical protein